MSEEDKELERIIKESLNEELACENITVSEELIQKTLAKAEAEGQSVKADRLGAKSAEAEKNPELDSKRRSVTEKKDALKREEKKNRAKNVMSKIIRVTASAAAACLVLMIGVQVMRNGAKDSSDSAQMESAESMDEGMGSESLMTQAPFESSAEKETASSDSTDAANDQMADAESDTLAGSAVKENGTEEGELQEEESQSITSSSEQATESENYNVSGDTEEGKQTIARMLLLLTGDQAALASSDAAGTIEMDVYMTQSETEAMEFCITSDGMLAVRAYEDGETKSEVTYELSDRELFKEQIRAILKGK